jgi:hypothetical protein
MSNICRRIAKRTPCIEKTKAFRYVKEVMLTKKYKSFNIFTKDGVNRKVDAPYPMTLEQAQYYFDALSIGGIE